MRKRNIFMSTVTLCWLLGGFFVYALTPISYEKQIDARKREYADATIINKFYNEGCSKSSCYRDYYFAIELSDGSLVESVDVTSEFYDSYSIGSTTAFERHIADPVIVKQQSDRGAMRLTCVLGAIGLLTIWVCINIFEGEE